MVILQWQVVHFQCGLEDVYLRGIYKVQCIRQKGLLTSLLRIWSSVSWTLMRGCTVLNSFHHGQSFTPQFFFMFF